jgi:hypothetical protein
MSAINPNYDGIPMHMHDAARRYFARGIPPGSFLEAVLCNDFKRAVSSADHINSQHLRDWMLWITWELPCHAQGSPEAYKEWVKAGGAIGLGIIDKVFEAT